MYTITINNYISILLYILHRAYGRPGLATVHDISKRVIYSTRPATGATPWVWFRAHIDTSKRDGFGMFAIVETKFIFLSQYHGVIEA